MEIMDIAFPNLGIYLRNMPKSFTVFGFEIALYGVIIGIGVIAGILMAARQAKVTGQDPDLYWDFSIYAVILSVVGARIYYVIFEWDMYKDNLLKIFNISDCRFQHLICVCGAEKAKSLPDGGYGRDRADFGPGHRKMGELYQPRGVRRVYR